MKTPDLLASLDSDLRPRLAAALDLFWRQALGAARVQGRVEALIKADSSPVTVVDLLHQTQVQQVLRREFPTDALLSEEPRNLQERHAAEAAEISRTVYGMEVEPAIVELPSSEEKMCVTCAG